MACTKNPKKLWKIKWNGAHSPEDRYVSIFGFGQWGMYRVSKSCKFCEANLGELILKETDMIKEGYSVEKLHEISFRFGKSAGELK